MWLLKMVRACKPPGANVGLSNYQEYSFTLENESGDAKPPSKDKTEKKRKKYHLGEACKH